MFKKLTIKAIIGLIMFFLIILAFENPSLAASFSASAAKTTLNVGDTTTLTITVSDCEGRFKFSSSDSSVVSVSDSEEWIGDSSNTYSVTLTAKKKGNAKITVTAEDVSDKSFNDVTGSKSVTITVSEPQSQAPSNGGGSSGGSSSGSSSSNKSSDATLKSITVGGKKYSNPNTDITISSVSASTSSITIDAETNNSNAKVSGTGTKALEAGTTNNFVLNVTAEDGTKGKYTVRVVTLAEESTTPNIVDENPPEEINDEGEATTEELRLTSLTIEGVELIPEFNSETFEYSVYITDQEELKIDAVANVEGTNVEILGNTGLIEGENIATIKLTKDDKVTEYKITINKSTAAPLMETPEENIIADEETEQKVGFIGMITDWWNKAGPTTLTFTIILALLGAAIIFAIVSYKYSSGAREMARHRKVDFIQNDDFMEKNE